MFCCFVYLRAVKEIKEKLQPIEQQLAEIESSTAGAPSLVRVESLVQELIRLCAQKLGIV